MSELVKVNTSWPAELRDQVRDLVGGRGLSAFVIEAVEARLLKLGNVDPQTDTGTEPGTNSEPAPTAVSVPVSLPHVRPVEAEDPRPDEAQSMSLAQIQATYGLVPASQVTAPPAKTENTCPTCQSPLVDDECWSCAF